MTRDDILSKAKWLQLPSRGKIYKEYKELKDKDVIKTPQTDKLYVGWPTNEHHFTTEYHRTITIPYIASILNFDFLIDDYNLEKKMSGRFDISLIYPKRDYIFDIVCYDKNESYCDVDFRFLTEGKYAYSDYHRLFLFPHMSSKIVNKTINNNRKLFLSGDSHMIPVIPVLACYFKEVHFFDNRTNKSYKNKYENEDYTDILFVICGSEYNKYTVNNLR